MMNLGDLQLDLLRTLKLRKLVDSFRREGAADIEVFMFSGAKPVALSILHLSLNEVRRRLVSG